MQSEYWYRVSNLKPFLRTTVEIARHRYRNEPWFMLRDPGSGQFRRTNRVGFALIERLDGTRTLDEIYESLLAQLGNEAPGQADIILALEQLAQGGLIQTDNTSDLRVLLHRAQQQHRQLLRAKLNPLSFQVALFNPATLLTALEPIGRFIVTPTALVAWFGLLLMALATAMSHSAALGSHLETLTGDARFFLLLWVTYPLLKAIHELAHGLLVRRFGGEVNEMGVRLLVLMPVPFVDASAATLFDRKHQRAAVAAAGIMAELAMASMAVIVWSLVGPGITSDLLLTAALIGSVSTVAFNGNPLMKFDGYYLLCDWLEMPNLAQRARQFFVWSIKRYLLFIRDLPRPHTARGETRWLLGYAILSWLYRVVVITLITRLAAGYSLVIAAALATFFAWTLLLRPLLSGIRFLYQSALLNGRRSQAILASAVLAALLLVALATPVPDSTVTGGIVWLPDGAQIRAEAAGNVRRLLAENRTTVSQHQDLVELDNPNLVLVEREAQQSLAELTARHIAELSTGGTRAAILREQLEQQRREHTAARQKVNDLTVRAARAGQLVLVNPDDLDGAWVSAGQTIGYVLGAPGTVIRTAISGQQYDRIAHNTTSVSVRFADEPGAEYNGRIVHASAGDTRQLPSPALSQRHGGQIRTTRDDPLRSIEPVVVLDVEVAGRTAYHAGQRATIRFRHSDTPVVVQVTDALRRAFDRQVSS